MEDKPKTIDEITKDLESADFLYSLCAERARNGKADHAVYARVNKSRRAGIIACWKDNINPEVPK